MSAPLGKLGRGRTAARGERGNSAVELALVLPVLMSIVFGAADFARVFYAYMTLASAAHETATYLAQNGAATDTELQGVAAAESQRLLGSVLTFTGPAANTTLTRVTSYAPGTAATSLLVRVQLTYTFKPVVPLPLAGSIPIHATAAAPKGRALT